MHEYGLMVPASALNSILNPTVIFFPLDASLINPAAEPRTSRNDGGLEIGLQKASEAPGAQTAGARALPATATLDGVLSPRAEDGTERAFDVSANPASLPPAEIGITWSQALLLAFLRGIVLTARPSVSPT